MGNEVTGGRSKVGRNYWYAVLSMAIVLFIVGLYGLVFYYGQRWVKNLQDNIQMTVELTNYAADSGRAAVKNVLLMADFVQTRSLRFVSKEEGWQALERQFGKDDLNTGGVNPLSDNFNFYLKGEFIHPDTLQQIAEVLKNTPFVEDVYYEEMLVKGIGQNLQKINLWALGIVVLLLFFSILLLNYTLQLSLYDDRFRIKTMQLIGATDNYIARPYWRRSAWGGGLSGLIAALGVGALLYFFERTSPDIHLEMPPLTLLIGSILLISFGSLTAGIAAYWGVKGFLRKDAEALY